MQEEHNRSEDSVHPWWRWIASTSEVIGVLSRFSVLVVAVAFVWGLATIRETRELERRQTVYQAWQVIYAASGKGGSGGVLQAVEELRQAGQQALGAINLSRAFLALANFNNLYLQGADFSHAELGNATFVGSILTRANFYRADLSGTDFTSSDLAGVEFREARLSGVAWEQIGDIRLANLYGIRDAPSGFLEWALEHGAVEESSEEKWQQALRDGNL